MSDKKIEFTGKEVADAIKKACEKLDVPQERLDIEVLETGSTGIFGLIRKKARIRVAVKQESEEILVVEEQPSVKGALPGNKKSPSRPKAAKTGAKQDRNSGADPFKKEPEPDENIEPASEESVTLVKETLEEILTQMKFPSTVEMDVQGIEICCKVTGEFDEYLTGQDGKVLDSIQYLLRKMVARKTQERIKLCVDVGDFREQRKEMLMERAAELALLVKEDGKTQVIPALNPSERRVVHMVLQDDKEIRSRSVGDGLFKKILIYKPGKGGRNDGRKRHHSRNRRNRKTSN